MVQLYYLHIKPFMHSCNLQTYILYIFRTVNKYYTKSMGFVPCICEHVRTSALPDLVRFLSKEDVETSEKTKRSPSGKTCAMWCQVENEAT